MTWDFDEEEEAVVVVGVVVVVVGMASALECGGAGEAERLRAVAGRPLLFFLKNGTITSSVDAMSICMHV